MDINNVIIVRICVLVHFCRRHGFSCTGNRSLQSGPGVAVDRQGRSEIRPGAQSSVRGPAKPTGRGGRTANCARRVRSAVALRKAPAPRLDNGCEVILENPRNTGTLRAAQVELPVRDGRNIRMPINAIPIRSGDAEVNSVTVTMQDLAPLGELERLRAEHPDMPSCEPTAANGRRPALQPRNDFRHCIGVYESDM